jgi:hypothetical protein
MTKTITFNELRRVKDQLPDGTMGVIAEKLDLTPDTVRNYFGGTQYESGESVGLHMGPGPDGGVVQLDDSTILDLAYEIIAESKS